MRDRNLTYYPENVSLADNGLKRNYLSANRAIMRYNACCFINFTSGQTDGIDGPLDSAESAKSCSNERSSFAEQNERTREGGGWKHEGVIVIVEHTAAFATREYFISETFHDTESFGALR